MVTSTSPESKEVNDIRYALDSAKILTDCCDEGVQCLCQLVHSGIEMRAVFSAFDEWGVEFNIPADEASKLMHPKAICCISFSYRTSFCAFVGRLLEIYQQASGERRVISTKPSELTVTNLRQSFRVPVMKEAGLEAVVRIGTTKRFTVTAVDIAEAGMEIEFAADVDHGLSLGKKITVDLTFREQSFSTRAEVRRLMGLRCGLFFPAMVNPDSRRHPIAMRGIVQSIQQVWLKNRLK